MVFSTLIKSRAYCPTTRDRSCIRSKFTAEFSRTKILEIGLILFLLSRDNLDGVRVFGTVEVDSSFLIPKRLGRCSGLYLIAEGFALCNGDFRSDVNEQPGSASVVQAVSRTPTGIGYSGMGFQTSGIRPLPLARRDGEPFVAATAANAIAGSYPLSRYLYLYLNHPPGTAFAPLQREFLRFVLSREGQSLVLRDGYVPLPAKVAARERLRVP